MGNVIEKRYDVSSQFLLQKSQTIFNVYFKIVEIFLIITQIKYSLIRENYNPGKINGFNLLHLHRYDLFQLYFTIQTLNGLK